jgi:hypothetical protein
MAESKPEFLKQPKASAPKDPFPNRPQPEGGSNKPDGGNEKFPNRPQPMKEQSGNPKSIPSGGKLPYPGPPATPKAPFKLGK